jgi:hypothetical protein
MLGGRWSVGRQIEKRKEMRMRANDTKISNDGSTADISEHSLSESKKSESDSDSAEHNYIVETVC